MPIVGDIGATELTYLIARLNEAGAELRSRRDPEYVYTAAAVGSFGAFAWGVAALAAARISPVIPGVTAAIGILFITIAVAAKTWREHLKHEEQRLLMASIVLRIEARLNLATAAPQEGGEPAEPRQELGGLRKRCEALLLSQSGFAWSLWILGVTALAAMIFCLSIAASRQVP